MLSLPYNIIDKNDDNNRNGIKPSYQYKKKRIIWLNTFYATSRVPATGTTYRELTFDVPQFQLFNQTKLSVISYVSNEDAAKPLIIKLMNLLHDNQSTYSNDKESYPIIYVNHQKVAGMLMNDKISLTLLPQMINNITIKLNNSFIARDAGFTISAANAGHFILGLLFEDDELVADNIVSQYK